MKRCYWTNCFVGHCGNSTIIATMQNLTPRIIGILILAFIVQMLTAWHTLFFHSDEYFQIVEFASYKLGFTPKAMLPWEFRDQIRPTIQPYIFQWVYQACASLGIHDRFHVFSVVHLLVGVLGFVLTNYLLIKKFRTEKYLYLLLLMGNFMGLIPFLRSSFSSETMGGLFLLLSILLIEHAFSKSKSSFYTAFASGLTLALCFFFRFQMAFALIGILLWLVINQLRQWKTITVIGLSFAIGVGLLVWLDSHFYGNFCFTPYNYYYANIVLGKAAAFGTFPWWYYLAVLPAFPVPLLSLFLFGLCFKNLFNIKNPYSLAMLFFLIGHSLVGHKEERFVFPMLFFVVYIAADAYRDSTAVQDWFAKLWNKQGFGGYALKMGIGFSVALNLIFLVLFAFEPYKQPVKFIHALNSSEQIGEHPTIYCYKQSPYNTESELEYHFLCENKYQFIVFNSRYEFSKALIKAHQAHESVYYALKYEDALNDGLLFLVEHKKGIVSSEFIWSVTNWLGHHYGVIIPDMWLLAKQ